MENNSYEIVIKDSTTANKKTPVAGNNSNAKSTTAASSNARGGANGSATSSGNEVRIGLAKTFAVYSHYIKPYVNEMFTQHITTVSLRTGAQELEERMSFTYSVGQQAAGFISSVVLGGLITGNPIGAVVGGMISLGTMAMDYANRQEKLNLQRDVENVGLRYLNMRAGGSVASFSGSRMKNQ